MTLPAILEGKQDIGNDNIAPGAELLEDVFFLDVKPGDLCEGDEASGKRPYLKGRLGWVDKATANKRLYPRKVMGRELMRLKAPMENREIYGELDHPGDGKTKLARVSHFVLAANITESGEIVGNIEFIPGTVNGDQALAVARAGGRLGVSSRGWGTLVPDGKGNNVVQEDFRLGTWDIVADPANVGAYPDFVVESKEEEDMDLEKLRTASPEAYVRLMEEAKKEVSPEAREHAREALRHEFEEQLRDESIKIREEAVEEARGQLLEDPTVAGASGAMERIKSVVAPFIMEEDVDGEIEELREQLSSMHERVAEQDVVIAELEEENEELVDLGKEFGFAFFLERELADNDRKDQIVEMLGDVSEYADLDELRERLSDVVSVLAEEDEKQQEYLSRIAELEAQATKLAEERDKALGIGHKFGIKAYIERKVSTSPHRGALRTFLDESRPASVEAVDRLVESFSKANPVSSEYMSVRRSMKERSFEKRGKLGKGDSLQLTESVSIGGISIDELAKMDVR